MILRYQYPPMDPIWHKALGLVMVVIGIIGWCGNGVVVYIFLVTPSLRTPSNLLTVNLAFSDFFMMIAMSPPMVVNCWYETWVLGEYLIQYSSCLIDHLILTSNRLQFKRIGLDLTQFIFKKHIRLNFDIFKWQEA